jgi:type IV fimbrial biogenesis protein FimT
MIDRFVSSQQLCLSRKVPRVYTRGMTLIELLVVLALLALLASLGAPDFGDLIAKRRLDSIAGEFVGGLQLARSEALKRNANVEVCQSSNADSTTPTCTSTGGWEQGWLVRGPDPLDPLDPNKKVVIAKRGSLTSGYLLRSNEVSVIFPSTGLRSAEVTFTLCKASPVIGSKKRTIFVGINGYPRNVEEATTTCP